MKSKQTIVKTDKDGELLFWCSGCNEVHHIKTMAFGQYANHIFNNDFEKPTITLESGAPFTCVDNPPSQWCHFTITNGIINYLHCSHHFADMAVEMREYSEWGGVTVKINGNGKFQIDYEY